ncbi:predicted protein [Plenodomus lingam JN3]|uniref:Predicted protein n=1 Tax=Leptosphaeria maculans (strain JN3 / isolate v23.1.3 / race Av1-4-5-6-7-8) TaxID=985895 RepID=E4ZNG1_LEPMJ|nr:predicted protein [Plenodomus lingam JN3]CBX93020.1 predicted protein [Plenodomus lingam JN3]
MDLAIDTKCFAGYVRRQGSAAQRPETEVPWVVNVAKVIVSACIVVEDCIVT